MGYVISKILTFLLQPSALFLLLIIFGFVLLARFDSRRRIGFGLAALGIVGYIVAGILPLGNALILPLEQRYVGVPPPSADDKIAGIIMLGGFEDGWVAQGRGGLAINEAGERLTEGIRLALKHPEAKIVFTGGVGGLMSGGTDAASAVGTLLQDWGIASDRIVLEGKSRNTVENAIFTREMLNPKPEETWVLVTSAYHMPRAVGVFRKAGFAVRPYPVDYRTHSAVDLKRIFETISDGLRRTDLAAREWMALIAYWATDRTDEFFPGPR